MDTSEGTLRALRAGAALYNAGEFHAAHDPWEERWLALGGDADTDADASGGDATERRLLKGLVQSTAAVYHATERNWVGATGLADSAGEYLAAVEGSAAGGLALAPVRSYLAALTADPEVIERRSPVRLELDGTAVGPTDLEFEAAALAALALAEEYGYEERVLERAVAFGRADLEAERATSPFVALVFDFAAGTDRPLVYRRLEEHVDRREHREADVVGLFDTDGGESSGQRSSDSGDRVDRNGGADATDPGLGAGGP